jgi:oligosaccharide reducing-end xylanase
MLIGGSKVWPGTLPGLSLTLVISACTERAHFLGYDQDTATQDTATQDTGSSAVPAPVDAAFSNDAGSITTNPLDASRVSPPAFETVDAAVLDGGLVTVVLQDPPNVLVDLLGLDPDRVNQRTLDVFEQLFFGDPATESIFVDDPEGAYVLDVLHDDTRMDAMGYAMLALPHFERQVEFDKLWSTVETKFRYDSGPRSGYFHSNCATDFSSCSDDIDTFGIYYVITALFIAESHWGGGSYAKAATDVLSTMRNKEQNGIVEGVLNLFGDDGLPRPTGLQGADDDVWTASLMPAFFELWYVHTLEPFWHRAAVRSRTLLQTVGHPVTGLAPERVSRAGEPTQATPEFRSTSYGVGFQMALDHAWVASQSGYTTSANLLVRFFGDQGPVYPSLWAIEGEALNEVGSGALIALNGAMASAANIDGREVLMRATWEMSTPTGLYRYYDGISQLLSLMFLGGQLRPR